MRELPPQKAPAATDGEAIARSLDDPEAFVIVFERHFDSVHRYLHRRLGVDLADDLAAETFTRAFAARTSFEPHPDGALPWLYGIATNLVRRHRRAEERQLRAYARTGRDDVVLVDVDALTGKADAERLGVTLAAALASLPRDERDTLCLVAIAGLTQEQAAAALGVPVGTVSSRLTRTRNRLRTLLPDHVPSTTEETL